MKCTTYMVLQLRKVESRYILKQCIALPNIAICTCTKSALNGVENLLPWPFCWCYITLWPWPRSVVIHGGSRVINPFTNSEDATAISFKLWVLTALIGYHCQCLYTCYVCTTSRDLYIGETKFSFYYLKSLTPISLFTMQHENFHQVWRWYDHSLSNYSVILLLLCYITSWPWPLTLVTGHTWRVTCYMILWP